MLLLLQRLSYLPPAAAEVVPLPVHSHRSVALNAILLVAAIGVNVALAVAVKRHGWFPNWLAGTDVIRRLIADDTTGGFTDLGDRLATVLDHAAPARTARGFGRRWSIAARMAEVGGTAEVIGAPGDGTCVTLTWSAG